jgi:hypothetical protein
MTPLHVFSAIVAEMFQASSTLCGQDQVKQKEPRSSEPGLLSFRVWSVADDSHGRFATSRSCFAQGYLDPNATYPSDNCIPLWTRNDAYLQQLK